MTASRPALDAGSAIQNGCCTAERCYAQQNGRSRLGFTIVELLVVITIIVVLLALLAPTLDTAVYQAELAVCGARLRTIATTANSYAMDHRRRYPYRESLNTSHNPRPRWMWPNIVVDEESAAGNVSSTGNGVFIDDRAPLIPYLGQNLQALHDPLTGGNLDYTIQGASLFVDYNLWFGMRYAARSGQGMYRVGDRLTWTEPSNPPRQYSFDVLASDNDVLLPGATAGVGSQFAIASHPDRDGLLYFTQFNSNATSRWARTRWERVTDEKRGPLDTNYAYADESVARMVQVTYNDPRMAHVPLQAYGTSTATTWIHLPESR